MKGGRLSPFVIDSIKGSENVKKGGANERNFAEGRERGAKKNMGYI